MAKISKSEWVSVSCNSDRDRVAIRSWFSPLCDDMTPKKAEILVDCETDSEKKLRTLMVDASGKERWAIRSKNKRGHTITLKAPETSP